MNMELLTGLLSISLIDVILSGDNAIVIGMAAHRLHGRQRTLAIVLGGGAAIVLRIALTAVATFLLRVPALQLVGGLLLLWIGFKLLKEEEEAQGHVSEATGLVSALSTILVADFVMSTDNILAVAARADGDLFLLLFGLGLSIPLLMFAGGIVAELMNRLQWLVYVGSGLIAWTGGEMIVKDKFFHEAVVATQMPSISNWFPAVTLVFVLGLAHWYHRRPSKIAAARRHATANGDAGSQE
ncbi:MAG: YjbE family putative metal transport protein [Chloroflexi bacterium]|nr:YjbE family putative metal transport protein [Chloroflexota bacterium]